MSFKFRAILSSVMKSRSSLFPPIWDMNHPLSRVSEAGDSIGRTLRLHCCCWPATSVLVARKRLLALR